MIRYKDKNVTLIIRYNSNTNSNINIIRVYKNEFLLWPTIQIPLIHGIKLIAAPYTQLTHNSPILPSTITTDENGEYFFEIEKLPKDSNSVCRNMPNVLKIYFINVDTSEVEDFHDAFAGNTRMTTLDVRCWNTRNVKSMQAMFWNCLALTSLDLSSFDTTKVETMYQMFTYIKMPYLNLHNFVTTPNTNISYIFLQVYSSNLKELRICNFAVPNNDKYNSLSFSGILNIEKISCSEAFYNKIGFNSSNHKIEMCVQDIIINSVNYDENIEVEWNTNYVEIEYIVNYTEVYADRNVDKTTTYTYNLDISDIAYNYDIYNQQSETISVVLNNNLISDYNITVNIIRDTFIPNEYSSFTGDIFTNNTNIHSTDDIITATNEIDLTGGHSIADGSYNRSLYYKIDNMNIDKVINKITITVSRHSYTGYITKVYCSFYNYNNKERLYHFEIPVYVEVGMDFRYITFDLPENVDLTNVSVPVIAVSFEVEKGTNVGYYGMLAGFGSNSQQIGGLFANGLVHSETCPVITSNYPEGSLYNSAYILAYNPYDEESEITNSFVKKVILNSDTEYKITLFSEKNIELSYTVRYYIYNGTWYYVDRDYTYNLDISDITDFSYNHNVIKHISINIHNYNDTEVEEIKEYDITVHVFNSYYTVNLNDNWRISTTKPNPDNSLFEGVFESYSNYNIDNSKATMSITIFGYTEFAIYIRSYAESNYDYTIAYEINSNTIIKTTTKGKQTTGDNLEDYTMVNYSDIDPTIENTITVSYIKDGSASRNDDRGYLLIVK